MGKFSVVKTKSLIQECTGLIFEKVRSEIEDGNQEIIDKVLTMMSEKGIGFSIVQQAGIKSKFFGVTIKIGRPNDKNKVSNSQTEG